jgi:hypothetical protein
MEFNLNDFKISVRESEYSIIIDIKDRATLELLDHIVLSKQELLDKKDDN